MEKNNKRSFLKDIWTSIRDFEKYEEFAADKISNAVKYILILTLIFTIAISLVYTYKFYTVFNEAKEYINKNIENIKLQEGKLEVTSNEPIIIENEKNVIPMIIIDTTEDVNEDEYLGKIKKYPNGLLVLREKVILVNSLISTDEEIYYEKLFSADIQNKEEFMGFISGSNEAYTYLLAEITILVYLFIIYFTSNLVDGVILGTLGYLFARIVKLRLRFKATFNIGIYALTLPIILNLVYTIVNALTGYKITYFQWMYTTISYIYVAVAILMIKTEIINQKIQLVKLNEIQDKVIEEELTEEEVEEDKKEDSKEPDKKEKNDKGEQPEGSNA